MNWQRVLKQLSKLGTLAIFVVNAAFVLGLAKIYSAWGSPDDPATGDLRLALFTLAIVCLFMVPPFYLLCRYVDRKILKKH